jgi:hypothetical protein
VSLQDQPEKRKGNFIGMGNGLHTPRWGYAANLSQTATKIPACNQCFQVLLQGAALPTDCTECDQWCVNESSIMLNYSPPKHYPFADGISQIVRPIKITYKSLTDTIVTTHTNIVSNHWSVDEAAAYMEVQGLNESCRLAVILRARNCILAEDLECNKESDPVLYEVMLRDRKRNPGLYKRWPTPAYWSRGVDLRQHIDAIMHLVFLGVVKTTMKKINYWTKVRGKHAGMCLFATNILEGISELNVQWMPLLPYRQGCFIGWVSENFVGMARVLPWFYSNIINLLGDPFEYVNPVTPQSQWTAVQNKAWLKSRGLTQKGKAKLVSIKVKEFMTLPKYEHALGPLGGPVADVLFMIRSLWTMTAHLMVRTINADHIKHT